jgi:hypothetical protein
MDGNRRRRTHRRGAHAGHRGKGVDAATGKPECLDGESAGRRPKECVKGPAAAPRVAASDAEEEEEDA